MNPFKENSQRINFPPFEALFSSFSGDSFQHLGDTCITVRSPAIARQYLNEGGFCILRVPPTDDAHLPVSPPPAVIENANSRSNSKVVSPTHSPCVRLHSP
ncbi:hypothetical protein AGDE_14478 [Angomonas deanei]|uniref:Uncharacterized protein n=1 Tax=Angomonas deanei TaxID=59799 RepID=A0A7G2CU38_9TRYP|nr:hypothetical protein AGDE_14478 [Angomonas deanei]CAD2222727.1 hypothetical protein, conserved [Angomonas deanei]|eukprot:EPY20788.1 hypothetical protein AGDE_14478 [Angomonas deanei]